MAKTRSKDTGQKKTTSPTDSIPRPPHTGDLEDSQSARTSFRLSQEGRDALVWLAQSHHVKYQDVFVRLVSQLMTDQYIERLNKDSELLIHGLTRAITEAAKGVDPKTRDSSARATYVVNKQVVKVLKNMSKRFQIPRDLLVDLALKLMRERRERETDVDRHNRERAFEILDHFDRSVATELESELQEILGDDDPILSRFGLIIMILSNLTMAIKSNLDNGTPIDPDDFSQSG